MKEGTRMKRFEKIFIQGTVDVMEIWVDRETGIHYLWHRCANAGGLTPLLDERGEPVGLKSCER